MPLKEVFFATWNLYALGGPGGKTSDVFCTPFSKSKCREGRRYFSLSLLGSIHGWPLLNAAEQYMDAPYGRVPK